MEAERDLNSARPESHRGTRQEDGSAGLPASFRPRPSPLPARLPLSGTPWPRLCPGSHEEVCVLSSRSSFLPGEMRNEREQTWGALPAQGPDNCRGEAEAELGSPWRPQYPGAAGPPPISTPGLSHTRVMLPTSKEGRPSESPLPRSKEPRRPWGGGGLGQLPEVSLLPPLPPASQTGERLGPVPSEQGHTRP